MTEYPEPPLTPSENTQRPPCHFSETDEDRYWDWVDQQVDRAKEDRMNELLNNPNGGTE